MKEIRKQLLFNGNFCITEFYTKRPAYVIKLTANLMQANETQKYKYRT
jgi:hypothetical protein